MKTIESSDLLFESDLIENNLDPKKSAEEIITPTPTPYPWPLLWRTILLLLAFLALGVCDAVKGPTLLDLKDLVGADISQISFLFMLSSIGSLVGCFTVGAILDRLIKFRYLILASCLVIIGITTSLLPYSPGLLLLYTVSFFGGFGSGALDTAGNVLLLDIWKGRESGPYMHALHFTFGVGAFLAPVVAKPFLFNADPEFKDSNSSSSENISMSYQTQELDSIWTIKTLYPILGCYSLIISIGFVLCFLIDKRKNADESDDKHKKEDPSKDDSKDTRKRILLVSLMSIFFFFYVGVEVSYGTYIAVFSVKSSLAMSRRAGSDITAIFWGTFAATRGLAILAAVVASPTIIMVSSFICCSIASLSLVIWAEASPLALQVCSGFLGLGTASIFATGLLWFESYITITNRIGAVFTIASSAGADVFPIIVGQFVESHPMVLMHLLLAVILSCILVFATAAVVGKTINKLNAEKSEATESLELKL